MTGFPYTEIRVPVVSWRAADFPYRYRYKKRVFFKSAAADFRLIFLYQRRARLILSPTTKFQNGAADENQPRLIF
jgi:hypothetical protein